MNTHPTKRLIAPDGEGADIDVMLVPLIEALWEAGYDTITCCQDLGESIEKSSPRKAAYWKGYVLLELPDDDAARLVNTAMGTREFRERMHWAAEGAWEVSSPLVPLPDGAMRMPWMQVHFPADQIDDLVNVLTADGRP